MLMATVCRNFIAHFFIPWSLQGLSATLVARSLTQLSFANLYFIAASVFTTLTLYVANFERRKPA